MTEVVWVYGASAAGKETFIHNLLLPKAAPLRQRLGWQDQRLGVCQESLAWVDRYPGDPTAGQERYKLVNVVAQLAERYDVVLIKGQDLDLALGTPLILKRQLPAATHRIIFLNVELDELFRRVTKKPWWRAATKRAEEEGWLEEQIDRLMELRSQFVLTTLDADVDSDYLQEPFPGNFV